MVAQTLADERLPGRATGKLLLYSRRYAGDEVEAEVGRSSSAQSLVELCIDGGPGLPAAFRECSLESVFRLPGQAQREGGLGLGLALVWQIAQRHGGSVRCLPRCLAPPACE